MQRNIKVVPSDSAWPAAFEEAAREVSDVLGAEVVTIHHIGSTSVPGLPAKPILDVMPVVRAIERVDARNEAMRAAGYTAHGEFGIVGRRYFTKGGDEARTHNVHVFAADNPEVEQHLVFRDFLRVHPEQAAAYGQLKQGLAAQFPHDIYGYMAGKDGWIKDTLQRARAWREEQR